MLRKLLFAAVVLVSVGAVGVAGLLAWTHIVVRSARTTLPSGLTLAVAFTDQGSAARVSYVNTATQPMPRSAVLSPPDDPEPNQDYVMSHPAFVAEWADGRMLLVDAGMTADRARAFGRTIELFMGAPAIQPLGSVADALGTDRARVRGIVFTHLHIDHVDGLAALCDVGAGPIDVFMTPNQARRVTHTTRDAMALVRGAACARIVELSDANGDAIYEIPGFEGAGVIAAAGHTPGSQMVVLQERGADQARRIFFAGDIANHVDGIRFDIGKPWPYGTFLVPEDEVRLGELRRFLRARSAEPDTLVVVAHDQQALEASGIPAFASLPRLQPE